MVEITASMVKELRERTGAGMMECKKALVESKGEIQLAEEIIAKSGHKKVAKSASRTAAEGRVAIALSMRGAVIAEINCETDFVARDQHFIRFAEQVVEKALHEDTFDNIDRVAALILEDDLTVEQTRQALIARIGENIQIRRLSGLKIVDSQQRFGSYIHHARIGVVVVLQGGTDELAKEVAMHVAAMKPQYLTVDEVPAPLIDKEKSIFMEKAKQSGKPTAILEKIVAGQIQKHFAEICLAGQPFFKDPEQTIASVLKAANATVLQMVRFEVGEGIEVVKKSFEEEVLAARGGNP